jgi:hypothetical protein
MTKSGWLVKRGGLRKNWKRRFVAVEPGLNDFSVLRYFDKEADFTATKAKHLGRFELVSDTKVLVSGTDFPAVKSTPWIFMVKFPSRELYLSATSEEDMNEWVSYLRSSIVNGEKGLTINPVASISPVSTEAVEVEQAGVEMVEAARGGLEGAADVEEDDRSCILGGDTEEANVVRTEDLRRKSTAAPFMVVESQEGGEAVVNLGLLSRYGHMLIFAIAFFPSLCYAIVFSSMLFGAEFYVAVTTHGHLASLFYCFAAFGSLLLYVLDFGLWEGCWAKAKHVCVSLCAVAIVAGAVTSAEDEPSYPMAIFLFSNVGFFVLAKRHPIIHDVKNEV